MLVCGRNVWYFLAEVINVFQAHSNGHEIYPAHKCKNVNKVGIFTFISRINTCVYLRQENVVVCQYFIFWKQLKCYAQRRCA